MISRPLGVHSFSNNSMINNKLLKISSVKVGSLDEWIRIQALLFLHIFKASGHNKKQFHAFRYHVVTAFLYPPDQPQDRKELEIGF